MKQDIITHIDNPNYLEGLYRSNKNQFKQAFNLVYPDLPQTQVAACWHERLVYDQQDISWGNRRELIMVIMLAVVAGYIAKIPDFFHLNPERFYTRNIGFVIFPVLIVYFGWKNALNITKSATATTAILAGLFFINWLPDSQKSDTLTLAGIHLLLFLWCVLGYAFAGGHKNNDAERLNYLKYNGELVIITTLIVIVGAITTAISINLFMLAGFKLNEEYLKNIPIFGIPAAIMMGTYLTQVNPQLVGKISPVIARLFTPLMLVVLTVYLITSAISQNSLYHDREFLLVFNLLLIGVMALIFFSVAGNQNASVGGSQLWILLMLSVVTIVINGIALSAIVFRISEWGFTPNRAAVMGSNILIFINLALVSWQLTRALLWKKEVDGVGKAIAAYLPVYLVWAAVVAFGFPFWFEFK